MLLLPLFLACAHPSPSPVSGVVAPSSSAATSTPTPSASAEEALAPRPFPSAALAAGIPQGTKIRLGIEQAGQPTVEQRWEFTKCTADAATIASKVYDTNGTLLTDEGEATTPWTELEKHASFPAAATTRTDDTIDGPLGHLDTWLYTVTVPGDDGIMLVKRYEFSKTMPGPPVLFTTERQGEEIFRMTMLERSTPSK